MMDEETKKEIIQKLNFLANCYTHLHNAIAKREISLPYEEFFEKVANVTNKICYDLNCLHTHEKEFREELTGTQKYVGNRLYEIEKRLTAIEKQKETKVKVKLILEDNEVLECINPPRMKPEKALEELLSTLSEREKIVVNARCDLDGCGSKTFKQIAKLLGIKSQEQARLIYKKAIRKCRHPTRKIYVDCLDDSLLSAELKCLQ